MNDQVASFEAIQIYSHAKKPQETDSVAKMQFCSCFSEAVCGGEVNPLLVYFLDKAWFHLNVQYPK